MKNDYRRYAPAGLIISLLGIIAGVGVLVTKGLAFAGLYYPTNPDLLNQIGFGAVGGLVIGLAVYTILDPDKAREFITRRQAQYGSNALIMLVAFTGILIVLNVSVFQNPKSWDVTEDKSNTLAPETLSTLQNLPEPVTALAFYSPNLNTESAAQLFEQFKTQGSGKFDYQFIDPFQEPGLAQEAGVTSDGEIILQMGENHEAINFASEQELTNGLIRLMNPSRPIVYFLAGHGERDVDSGENTGFSEVRTALENRNYIVKTFSLQTENAIPADAKVIVIAGPLVPLTPEEVGLLDGFLSNGGALIVMEDPVIVTQFGEAPDPLAGNLSEKWGVRLNNDIIINPEYTSNPLYASAATYAPNHPITERMNRVAAIFPIARSLTVNNEANPTMQWTQLVVTPDNAWGEADIESINANNPVFDAQVDIPAPTVVAAARDSVSGARLVVFGNSSFALNSNFSAYGNSDFLLNTVDWAAGEESILNLTSKNPTERTFNPPGSLQLIGMVLVVVCLIPLVVIGAGVASWISRRRRG